MRELAESYAPADPVVLHATSWAHEFGVTPVSEGAGSALRLLAAAARARSVVEIGTGTGVSGLWLLRGMRPDGVLTTIDIEPEHQAIARQAFAAAGFAPGRARVIAGACRTVLGRLNDDAYDLVFIDGAVTDYPHCVSAAHRLLRDGGLVVINNAFGVDGAVVDLTIRDVDTLTLRELVAYVRQADEWCPTLLFAGTGLLCATKQPCG
jgi:predicted O-methyltransferase YrrM